MAWGDDASRFLARVLPWPSSDQDAGYVNIHWTRPNNRDPSGKKVYWNGKPFTKLKDAMGFLRWLYQLEDTKDVYFCTSLQAQTTRNSKDKEIALRALNNVVASKVHFLDIDVKPEKGYASEAEAITALGEFCKSAKVPFPSILVGSGGGIHAYWEHAAQGRQEWQPAADALRDMAVAHGLKLDPQCTVDMVRILRVPETFNHKTNPPRPVRLIYMEAASELS